MANGITDLGPDRPEQQRQQREPSLYSGVPEHLVPFADSLQAILGGEPVPVAFRYNRPGDPYRPFLLSLYSLMSMIQPDVYWLTRLATMKSLERLMMTKLSLIKGKEQ